MSVIKQKWRQYNLKPRALRPRTKLVVYISIPTIISGHLGKRKKLCDEVSFVKQLVMVISTKSSNKGHPKKETKKLSRSLLFFYSIFRFFFS